MRRRIHDRHSGEEARIYDFDNATAVTREGGGSRAAVDAGWTIGGRPNGGYLLALVTRAALQAARQPHPLAVSAQFVSPPSPGPAELETTVLRAGRSVDSLRVALLQDGQPCLEALVSAGSLERGEQPVWAAAAGPPELAPVEDCVRGQPELPWGVRVPILEHLDVRLDPSSVGWLKGDPSGSLRMLGWVRFADGRPLDPLALLQAADALPPASFELGIVGWAPTVQMSVWLRSLPADGWLRCAIHGSLLESGWFDEQVEVWDERGRLVAQGHQLAGARTDRQVGGAGRPPGQPGPRG
ncbi:MAG TPA: thioesterase family protein [Actinomycetes bacterium]